MVCRARRRSKVGESGSAGEEVRKERTRERRRGPKRITSIGTYGRSAAKKATTSFSMAPM